MLIASLNRSMREFEYMGKVFFSDISVNLNHNLISREKGSDAVRPSTKILRVFYDFFANYSLLR
jgi:hypothetical protein